MELKIILYIFSCLNVMPTFKKSIIMDSIVEFLGKLSTLNCSASSRIDPLAPRFIGFWNFLNNEFRVCFEAFCGPLYYSSHIGLIE